MPDSSTVLLEQIRKVVTARETAALAALVVAVGTLACGTAPALHPAPDAKPRPAQRAARRQVAAETRVRTDLHGDPLPPGALARLGSLRFRHGSYCMGVAFSPDGKLLASKGAYGKGICLWDPATGRELRCIEPADAAQDNRTYSLAFSPDGKTLASVKGGSARLYDVASGTEVRRLQLNKEDVFCVAFSPYGKLLATGQGVFAGTISLWDSDSGREIRRLQGHGERVLWVVFAPDGKTLASAGLGRTIRLWDVATGKEIHRLARQENTDYWLAFSPDGKLLAAPGKDRRVDLWDPATGKLVRTLDPHLDEVCFLAFAPGGKILAVGGGDEGTVCLLDVATGKEHRRLPGHAPLVSSLAFAPDGKTLAAAGHWDAALHLWDVATGKEIHVQLAHSRAVLAVAFSADGRSLTSYGVDNRALIWDLTTGKARKQLRILPRLVGGHYPAAFGPGGRLLAYPDSAQTVALWDMDQGKTVRRVAMRVDRLLALSPDGKVFACDSADRTIRLWDVPTGKELWPPDGKREKVYALAFAPDSQRLATRAEDGKIRIWQVGTGHEQGQWESGTLHGTGLAFSPDGTSLALVETGGGTPRLWDVATGMVVRRLSGQEDCHTIAFSPDGRLVALGAWMGDPTVRLCETLTGQEVRRYRGHFGILGCVTHVAFSPDGRSVVSVGGDATILPWDVTGQGRDGQRSRPRLGAKELSALWSDLGGPAPQAHTAAWRLVAAPEQAVPLLHQRLGPIPASVGRGINGLITDLASERFAVRERAARELAKLGDQVVPALRQAPKEQAPLEVRRRLELLLETCYARPVLLPELLRQLRAVMILEHVETVEARRLLETVAHGAPEVRLTQEAKAAVQRLTKRPAP
jgi:WD40 repeat protein